MKVRGDNAPGNAFTVEAQPKTPGHVLVRFYENAKPFEEAEGDLTITGWEYDEYRLEIPDSGNVEAYVLANYGAMLAKAKGQEEPEQTPEEKIAALEVENAALSSQVTDMQMALCDVYEMALGGAL